MIIEKKLMISIIRKIIFAIVIFIAILTIGVRASKNELKYVTIVFPEGFETTVLTKSNNVGEILADNRTIVMEDEEVNPPVDSNIDVTKMIVISKKAAKPITIAEEVEDVTTEEILGSYVTITEKIITEQVEIPYETVTKDTSEAGKEAEDKVIQEGKNGLKEIKYRAKFQGDQEIERTIISETIIKEPVEKIVQITTKVAPKNIGRNASASSLEASVAGMTPTVVNMNTSAYCSCAKCCGKSNGITSSGAKATEWCTVAAGSGYPIGTVIYIPALSSAPNGGWFVVQDRGGAISNNRIDIYMGSHAAALQFGRKNLQCYVYR